MKQKSKIAGCCFAMLMVMTGCVKEYLESAYNERAALQVVGVSLEQGTDQKKSMNETIGSRAAEINNVFTFESDDALSLFVRGANYSNVENRKVTYSKPGADAGTWAIDGDPIYLHNETAIVSLVYPYIIGCAFNNVPFTTGVYSPGKDLLWKQQSVYYSVFQAKVTGMSHALARVKILLKREEPGALNSFVGTGAVSQVAIGNGTAVGTAAAIFKSGKLDLSFMAPAEPVTGITAGDVADDTHFTLSTTEHTTDLLTLPIAELKENLVTLRVVVDGMIMTTSLPFAAPAATKWEAGSCYTYTVTVKSKGIKIISTKIEAWQTGNTAADVVATPS